VTNGHDEPPYGDREPDDPSEWTEIDLEGLIGLPPDEMAKPEEDRRHIPCRAFIKRFKSSSPDSELFLHDPLRQMTAAPGALAEMPDWPSDPGDDPEAIAALHDDPRWHTTTFVANHHRRLSKVHAYAMALIGPDGVHLMIYKDAEQA
jgi:hypothetical protein